MIPYFGVEGKRLLWKPDSKNPTRSMKNCIAIGILSEALAEAPKKATRKRNSTKQRGTGNQERLTWPREL